jgi:hypothetical protein
MMLIECLARTALTPTLALSKNIAKDGGQYRQEGLGDDGLKQILSTLDGYLSQLLVMLNGLRVRPGRRKRLIGRH